MNLGDYLDDLARSVGFLSRFPVPGRFFEGHDGQLSRACGMFPVAGLLIVLPAAIAFAILLTLDVEPLLAAFLTLAVLTLTTGGLHEDGLADSADGVYGARDRGKALEIMRDSRVGSYGAIALVLGYGIRAAGLLALSNQLDPVKAAIAYIAISALSRSAMVWHWSLLPPARTDGLAASAGVPDRSAVWTALLTAALIASVCVWPSAGFASLVLMLGLTALATWAMTHYIGTRIGGHTGDTIGAAQQCAEIAALTALAVAL